MQFHCRGGKHAYRPDKNYPQLAWKSSPDWQDVGFMAWREDSTCAVRAHGYAEGCGARSHRGKEVGVARFLKTWLLLICVLGLPARAGDVPDTQFVVAAGDAIVLPPQDLQELPEPAVLAMMLLGICVIGYRARRDSKETFR
jgi:hypothetical protein